MEGARSQTQAWGEPESGQAPCPGHQGQQRRGKPVFGFITMLYKEEPAQARDKHPILQMRKQSPREQSLTCVNDSGTSALAPYSAPLPIFHVFALRISKSILAWIQLKGHPVSTYVYEVCSSVPHSVRGVLFLVAVSACSSKTLPWTPYKHYL